MTNLQLEMTCLRSEVEPRWSLRNTPFVAPMLVRSEDSTHPGMEGPVKSVERGNFQGLFVWVDLADGFERPPSRWRGGNDC